MNNEFERMWKVAVIEYLTVVSRYLPGWTEENHNRPQLGCPVYGSSFG
jgi:hypothetical protein